MNQEAALIELEPAQFQASKPLLSAEDVWFSYNGNGPALQGAQLTVQRGLMTMILGRSGCGKTTLLKIFKGLINPQKGNVSREVNVAEIAYIPQTLGLVRSLSALENTLMGVLGKTSSLRSLISGFPKDKAEEAVEVLTRLGLRRKCNERVYALSGGERQRVAIARALMQHPRVILADEFVSQLDPLTAQETLNSMRALILREELSFVITTHETDMVAEYADQVVIMKSGKIAHEEKAQALSMKQMLDWLA